MKILYFNSFLRNFKDLPIDKRSEIERIITHLITCLEGKIQPSKGLGLKKLKEDFWEIRLGLDLRIVFTIEPGTLNLLFVGSHDKIKRYLKTL